ncbi:MAG: hypothetical protein MUE85_12105 [Microscillaceae bacterium]|jgi:hypothetical protein|nr:hypothetical protein [Microscillaceae bacterium]
MRLFLLIGLFMLIFPRLLYGQESNDLFIEPPELEYAFLSSSGTFKHQLHIYYGDNKQTEDFLDKNPQANLKGKLDRTWEIMTAFQYLNRKGYKLISSHAYVFSSGSTITTYIFARSKIQSNPNENKNK